MMNFYSNWRHDQDYKVIDLANNSALLFITENHRLIRVSSSFSQLLRGGLHLLPPQKRAQWHKLVEAGIVSDENRDRLASSRFDDGANLAINVNLTSACNLNCIYCFAHKGDYGRITGKMAIPSIDYIFDFIREKITPSQTVRFEFFGGEPLLNFECIKEICQRSNKIYRETGIHFIFRISTNLTVLPPGTLELFAANQFIVSAAIDGCPETHNRNRPLNGNKGSFETIVNNCIRVREASEAITLVARMTVVSDDPPIVDNVKTLWDYNLFDYFQIYPGFVPDTIKDKIFSFKKNSEAKGSNVETGEIPCRIHGIHPTFIRQMADFIHVYQEFFDSTNRFRGVLEVERIVDLVARGKIALSFCSGGRNYFTFSPDNSIMPCHRLVGNTRFRVGWGQEGVTKDLTPWRLTVDEHPKCSKCWIRYICGGGCKQENEAVTGNINEPNPEMCKYQTQLVESVLKMMSHRDEVYRLQDRASLDNLFVSCGRPVIANLRKQAVSVPSELIHFQSL
ncbi:MAG: SPASM domain-containing protein [Candidatus Aminicenantes bacterium]|jgi:radical SAM protein with 4Fe4S-binding SPASM domain